MLQNHVFHTLPHPLNCIIAPLSTTSSMNTDNTDLSDFLLENHFLLSQENIIFLTTP